MGTPGSPPIRLTAVPDKWVQPTRRPADMSRLGVQDKTSADFAQRRSTGYGKMCNVDLGLLVVTDQESGNRPHSLANIRQTRRPLVPYAILKQSTPTTGRRVLLSGGPNHYKIVVVSVFRVLVFDLRVLSLRFCPAEQLNHWD
jgi:hypothetical protein